MNTTIKKHQDQSPLIDRRRYGLPFVKIGRRVMYRLANPHAFIKGNTVGGEGPR
jgi:hypothetical protein